jgi:hypothetical protein
MKTIYQLRSNTRWRIGGHVIFVVLASLAILSAVAGQILMSSLNSYRSMHRAANWKEALVTAEAGVDIAVAELTKVLPDVRLNKEEGLGLSLPTSLIPDLGLGLSLQPGSSVLPLNLSVTLTPPPLEKQGEGSSLQQAKVSIDVLPLDVSLSSLLNLSGGTLSLQLVRVRSTGIAYLDASRVAGAESEENALRRPTLVFDAETGRTVNRPRVSRSIEVMLRPAFAFQDGVISEGKFQVDGVDAIFDSFNSLSSVASTERRYDPAKRLQNANVQTNGAEMDLVGRVFGDVSTNGGNIEKSSRITGDVNNQAFHRVPGLRPPTWSGSPLAPSTVTGNVTVSAGAVLLPARYKFANVSGNLTIDRGLLGIGSHVEIWVTGDVTGTVRIADGVQAKVYVQGSIDAPAGAWQNGSHRASDLQIYGLSNGSDVETMNLSLANGFEAAIYAPDHEVIFPDSGDFSGAVTAGAIWVKGNGRFHYDEALALNLGPILRFDIAGWREITPGI